MSTWPQTHTVEIDASLRDALSAARALHGATDVLLESTHRASQATGRNRMVTATSALDALAALEGHTRSIRRSLELALSTPHQARA